MSQSRGNEKKVEESRRKTSVNIPFYVKCLEKANLYKQQRSDFLRPRMGVRLTVDRFKKTFIQDDGNVE